MEWVCRAPARPTVPRSAPAGSTACLAACEPSIRNCRGAAHARRTSYGPACCAGSATFACASWQETTTRAGSEPARCAWGIPWLVDADPCGRDRHNEAVMAHASQDVLRVRKAILSIHVNPKDLLHILLLNAELAQTRRAALHPAEAGMRGMTPRRAAPDTPLAVPARRRPALVAAQST